MGASVEFSNPSTGRRVLRQDRHEAGNDQREFAVRLVVEGEPDLAGAGLFDPGDLRHACIEGRAALLGQQLIGEDHVLRRDGFAVRPFRGGIDREFDPRTVVGHGHGLRQQAIEREGLVGAARHQRFEYQLAVFGVPHAPRRRSHRIQHERIEGIEGAGHAMSDLATLRRFRIDVGKVAEIRRQGRLAQHRDRVDRLLLRMGIHRKQCDERRKQGHHSRPVP